MGQVFDDTEMEVLIQTFLTEADEFIEEMEAGLLALEDNQQDSLVVDQVFRAAHSLKGSSMAVGLNQVGKFTHEVEALLLKVKEKQIPASREVISVLLECNDHIKTMIETLKTDLSAQFESDYLLKSLRDVGANPKVDAGKVSAGFALFDDEPETQVTASEPTPVAKDSEEGSSTSGTSKDASANSTKKKSQEQIKVSQERVDNLVNNIGEMSILLTILEQQSNQFAGTGLEKIVKQLNKIGKEVQDVSVSLRMLPVKPLFQKLRRVVRDTAAKLGKKINFEVIGEDIEIDKSILDQVGDPLVHIIRNAVDHGIEMPQDRRNAGKVEEGTIVLEACFQNGRLMFYVRDNGGGINAEKVRQKAVKVGILKESDKMPLQDLHNLIFHPGFSTKDEVSDISGRGVGMDVVKTNIQEMSGEIKITSEFGKGSVFHIALPQTFSIIEGSVVMSGDTKFVLPLADIQESVKISDEDISLSTSLGEILNLRGQVFPIFRCEELLNLKDHKKPREQVALISKSQDKNFALIVDEIIGRQPIVIKSLGSEMQGLKDFSGSTILSDGKLALIIEPSHLIKRKEQPKLKAERIVS